MEARPWGSVSLQWHLSLLWTQICNSQDTGLAARTEMRPESGLNTMEVYFLLMSQSQNKGFRMMWNQDTRSPGAGLLCCRLQQGTLSSRSKMAAAAPSFSPVFGQDKAERMTYPTPSSSAQGLGHACVSLLPSHGVVGSEAQGI